METNNLEIKDLVKAFALGSSLPVFLYYFIRVYLLQDRNYSYFSYTLINPLYFGIMNVIATYLISKYSLSYDFTYRSLAIISAFVVFGFAHLAGSYDWNTKNRWTYLLTLLITHYLTFNLVLRELSYRTRCD